MERIPVMTSAASTTPVKVGFVLHVMQVAGAEMLVAETIRRLGARITPTVFCLDRVGALGERLQAEGVDVIGLNRRPGVDFGVSWRMAKELRHRQIDVLHAHQYTPFFYAAIAARLSGVAPRVIFTEHGRHFPDVVPARRRLTNRMLLGRLADRVNAVCEFSARSLRERDGFHQARIEVIQNGVDAERYAGAFDRTTLLRTLGLDPDRRYVVCVARFHPVKDHRTLLSAFAEVARVRDNVDLLLVGDGALRGDLEQMTRDLDIEPRVRFLGVREDVADIMRAADLFAMTSLSEASSITVLEAMASEKPVVVTSVGGNPEIVRDGTDGILAPRADAPAVARAILHLLDNPQAATSMGRSAAERVRAFFTLDRTIERYYRIYAERRPGPGATLRRRLAM